MEILLKFYGIDWLVLVLVLIQMWLLGSRRKSGFLVGILATCFGMVFSYMSGSAGNAALGLCLFYLHARGYFQWRAAEEFGPPRIVEIEDVEADELKLEENYEKT